MLAARIAVLVEIGQRVDLGMVFVAVGLAQHMDLHLAEIPRESHLRRRRQIDIPKQNQLVVKKGLIDLGEYRRRNGLRQRNTDNFTTENWMQRSDLKWPIARCRRSTHLGLRHENLPEWRRLCQERRRLPSQPLVSRIFGSP